MTRQQFRKYLSLIFGAQWKRPSAKALSMHPDTVLRIDAGRKYYPVPERVGPIIKKLLIKRRKEIDESLEEIDLTSLKDKV